MERKPLWQAGYHEKAHHSFGMIMVGRNWESGSGYMYGFNGKVNDDEITGNNNSLDFGARMYDARLGRFFSRDFYTEMRDDLTPYNFADNCPIRFIDYNGFFKLDPYFIDKYPALAVLLYNYAPLLADNEWAKDAWTRITGLSDQDYINMVTFGSGPWVTPTRISCASDDYYLCGGPCDNYIQDAGCQPALVGFKDFPGYWSDDAPENIFIRYTLLENFEDHAQAFIESGDADMLNFLVFQMMVLIMHEGAHWGLENSNSETKYTGPDETGGLWELRTFGFSFSYGNSTGGDYFDYEGMKNYHNEVFMNMSYTNNGTFGFTLPPLLDNWKIFQVGVEPTVGQQDPTLIETPPYDKQPGGLYHSND